MGCAYNLFYASQNIVLGGFGGLSMLISQYFSRAGINIDMNIIYLILNLIIFVFAVKLLGKKFAIYTIVGISSYTVFLSATAFVSALEIPPDLLLCCLYGGVLTGIGIGIVVRAGGSTGGGDLLGCICNRISRKFTVGNVSMAINFFVVGLSILTFGIELALYAIIAIYISAMMTDIMVEGPKSVKAYYIISNKYVEISDKIMTELGRGVTALYGEGMHSGNDQRVLLCIAYKHQVARLKNIIYETDNRAFVFSVSVNDAMGKGFTSLKPSQTILQKIILKNENKVAPTENQNEKVDIFSLKPSSDGINVFQKGFKEELDLEILPSTEITDSNKVDDEVLVSEQATKEDIAPNEKTDTNEDKKD